MKLKEFEVDELPWTRMEDINKLSPTVMKIDTTKGMIFTDLTVLLRLGSPVSNPLIRPQDHTFL